MQQTPKPAAHSPAALPPLAAHSAPVKQTPVRLSSVALHALLANCTTLNRPRTAKNDESAAYIRGHAGGFSISNVLHFRANIHSDLFSPAINAVHTCSMHLAFILRMFMWAERVSPAQMPYKC